MFMMVIAHAHERCFLLQEELDFRLYEAVLRFAGTQHYHRQPAARPLAVYIEAQRSLYCNAHTCRNQFSLSLSLTWPAGMVADGA